MISVSVKADVKAVEHALGKAKRSVVIAASMSALNKTIKNVQVEAAREIKQHRALPIGEIKRSLLVRRATKYLLRATLIGSGRPISLSHYGARQTTSGASVLVDPSRGRKTVSRYGNKTFQVQSLGNNVFVRTGRRRLPIEKLFGPNIPSAMLKSAVKSAMTRVATTNWPKRFNEELSYRLRRLGFTISKI